MEREDKDLVEPVTNGEGQTVVTLQEMLIMIGSKEVELQKQRFNAEALVARRDAEIRALRAECERLRGSQAHGTQALPVEVIPS